MKKTRFVPAVLRKSRLLRTASILCLLGISAVVFFRFSPYPALSRFKNRAVSTRIFDRDGKLIQILALEEGIRREHVSLSAIPAHTVRAFIESEDRRFYAHHGIDISALFRALFQNVSEGRTVSGASTITMQLARLIKPHKNRNIFSKIIEACDALRLEERLSKEQILELYLNNLPFGFNCEGVASASRTFFNTAVERLTPEQSCCLAVIPRRPSLYNPLTQSENCAKAAFELNSSVSYTQEDFLAAARASRSFSYPFEFPHLVRYLRQNPTALSPQTEEITLSVSLTLQKKAESLLASEIDRYRSKRISNGSVLIIDTKTGEILCWVGSASYSDREHGGEIDGVLTREQPGSSMKPFLYALALESSFSPSSVLPDIPLEFGFEELYVPQNFNNRYSGPVRLRVALASSLNVPAVYLLNQIGLETYHKKLGELSFESLKDSNAGLSLALGGAEVSLSELVQAFSVFPRDGIFVPLNAGENLTLHENKDIRRVFDSDTARLICQFLSDDSARATGFGYSQTFQTSYPSMFKTGTANQYQNITALGSTTDYTVGVWMGNFTGETIIGKTGSSIPAKIARTLLDYLSEGSIVSDFPEPSQYTIEEICPLSGLKAGDDCPSSVFEYVHRSDTLSTCSWHHEGTVTYPAEYSSWFRLKNRQGAIENSTAPLQIVSPREGSVFIYDDGMPSQKQNVSIEAIGGTSETARIFVDGSYTATISRPFVYPVPLARGNHTVTFEESEESIASVSFVVE